MNRIPRLFLIASLLITPAVLAEKADVIDVQIAPGSDNTYRFDVTVSHADEGWDHYADQWDVVAPDGKILGSRVLLHPHETEQPFTRSLSGIEIPQGLDSVTVRARDSVHGYGGKEMSVEVPR